MARAREARNSSATPTARTSGILWLPPTNDPAGRSRPTTMKDRILGFLSRGSGDGASTPVGLETNLFDEGVLDSFRLAEFVTFLEAEAGVSLSADDINDDRFTSVAGILELLAAKSGAKPAREGGA
jgi:acyl carrier protein